jgi:hypothetical protein
MMAGLVSHGREIETAPCPAKELDYQRPIPVVCPKVVQISGLNLEG